MKNSHINMIKNDRLVNGLQKMKKENAKYSSAVLLKKHPLRKERTTKQNSACFSPPLF